MNRTVLLALLSRCAKVIRDELDDDIGATAAAAADPTSAAADPRKTYDNAYFYILVIMSFYCFLTLALFKKFFHSKWAKKDPSEEFSAGGLKLNTGPEAAERFDFEDECIL